MKNKEFENRNTKNIKLMSNDKTLDEVSKSMENWK
jgi:hypothetical protein